MALRLKSRSWFFCGFIVGVRQGFMRVEKRLIMGLHLSIKHRVVLQYQIEKYTNVSVLSLFENLKVILRRSFMTTTKVPLPCTI